MDHAVAFASALPSGYGGSGRAVAICCRRDPFVSMGSDKGKRDGEKTRPPNKIIKRVSKARDRLLELVPYQGDFPTLDEIEAALAHARADIESDTLKEQSMKNEKKSDAKKAADSKIAEAAETGGLQTSAIEEAPVAGFEVCTGKSCMRQGSADLLATMLRNPGEDDRPVVPCQCLGKCKELGVTVKVIDDFGSSTVLCVQDLSNLQSELTRNGTKAGSIR
jgi:hypothetical protein